MTQTRKWTVSALLVVALIAVAGWMLLVSPKRGEAAQAREDLAAQEATNVNLRSQIETLKLEQADLPAKQAELAAIRLHIPLTPGEPALIRSLTDIAKKSGVVIGSIAPATPQPVVTAAPATTTTTEPTTTAEGAATETAGETPPATVTAPASSLQTLPMQVKVYGSFFETVQFMKRLEELQRSFLVTGFTTKYPDVDSGAADAVTGPKFGDVETTIDGRIFFSPGSAVPTAAPSAAPAQ